MNLNYNPWKIKFSSSSSSSNSLSLSQSLSLPLPHPISSPSLLFPPLPPPSLSRPPPPPPLYLSLFLSPPPSIFPSPAPPLSPPPSPTKISFSSFQWMLFTQRYSERNGLARLQRTLLLHSTTRDKVVLTMFCVKDSV